MGSVVHEVLEKLYKPYTVQLLSPEVIDSFLAQHTRLTEASYKALYSGGDLSRGKNLLLMHLTQRFIQNFLAAEKRFLEKPGQQALHIVALEEELEAMVDVEVQGRPCKVRLRGKADRIDMVGSTLRVIDYKTGKLKYGELKVKDWDAVTTDSKYAKVFQLMAYALMYKHANPDVDELMPGIYSMREPGKGLQTLVFPEGEGLVLTQHADIFTSGLQTLLQELLDPDIPFVQTTDERNCRYCPFLVSCSRQG